VNDLVAQFEMHYPRGAKIHAEFTRPATGFSITAIFGPSGCGKTTVLRCLAGLERPQQGMIAFGDDIWLDRKLGIHRSPMERNIGFLFQEYALFPHLTVVQNIGYGLRQQPSTERQRMVHELHDRFGLSGLGDRYPHQISGGQQQRVALARTLARRPSLLLLDEPLSALDSAMREQMRHDLRALLTDFDIPMILVTHDKQEAIALADGLIVMDQGKILQSGTVDEVFNHPVNEVVARMVGIETIVPGIVVNQNNGTVILQINDTRLIARASDNITTDVYVCISADTVQIADAGSDELASGEDFTNHLTAKICNLFADGRMLRLELDCGFRINATIFRHTAHSLQLAIGSTVKISIPASAIHAVPR